MKLTIVNEIVFFTLHGVSILIGFIAILVCLKEMKIITSTYKTKYIPIVNIAFMMCEALYFIITIGISM